MFVADGSCRARRSSPTESCVEKINHCSRMLAGQRSYSIDISLVLVRCLTDPSDCHWWPHLNIMLARFVAPLHRLLPSFSKAGRSLRSVFKRIFRSNEGNMFVETEWKNQRVTIDRWLDDAVLCVTQLDGETVEMKWAIIHLTTDNNKQKSATKLSLVFSSLSLSLASTRHSQVGIFLFLKSISSARGVPVYMCRDLYIYIELLSTSSKRSFAPLFHVFASFLSPHSFFINVKNEMKTKQYSTRHWEARV